MPFSEGNSFWQARSSHGRKPVFACPDKLWEAACEYFAWVEENPFLEAKSVMVGGSPELQSIPKMRPMTEMGLVQFMDIGWSTWDDYKHKDDFSEVVKAIENIIYNQKFSGAAAGFFNANIIARDLGLAEKSERELSGSLEVKAVEYTIIDPKA